MVDVGRAALNLGRSGGGGHVEILVEIGESDNNTVLGWIPSTRILAGSWQPGSWLDHINQDLGWITSTRILAGS